MRKAKKPIEKIEIPEFGKYIGTKLIEAKELSYNEYVKEHCEDLIEYQEDKPGYLVIYPDGYKSWSPKEVFEKAYLEIGPDNTITKQNIEQYIDTINVTKLGEKTTVVCVELINGFVIVESSSCVDPANYDNKIGVENCLEKIDSKIWELLGFQLQTGIKGLKPFEKNNLQK